MRDLPLKVPANRCQGFVFVCVISPIISYLVVVFFFSLCSAGEPQPLLRHLCWRWCCSQLTLTRITLQPLTDRGCSSLMAPLLIMEYRGELCESAKKWTKNIYYLNFYYFYCLDVIYIDLTISLISQVCVVLNKLMVFDLVMAAGKRCEKNKSFKSGYLK